MQVITETELLDQIRGFLDRHEMAPTTFGRKATGNANLVKELEEGKSPSLRTVQKVAKFMADTDAEAATQAKLHAPLAPSAEEAEVPLPFSTAPVNPTGAASPTSSSTIERPVTPPASDSSPASSSTPDGQPDRPNPSCSADEVLL